jgi:SAM-dependent methyltransferase
MHGRKLSRILEKHQQILFDGPPSMENQKHSESDREYLEWLRAPGKAGWRRWVDVQAPYRWNIARLNPGRVLEIGAGIGRNLENFEKGSVGVEINRAALEVLRSKGLVAHHTDEFAGSPEAKAESFDSLLFSHVAEHMSPADFAGCVATYSPFIRRGGKLIVICPQERGFATDKTHVHFMDHDAISAAATLSNFREIRRYSFPFPRFLGKLFTYNEFVSVFVKN